MSESKSAGTGGIGLFGALGIVFVVLKLTGYIDWSWWWVTLPFWGPMALILLVGGLIGCMMLAVGICGGMKPKKRGLGR